jgi:hypothetical protein
MKVMATGTTGTDASTNTGMEYGPIGYIYHMSSKRPIGPSGGKLSFPDDTELVVYDSKKNEKVIQFRFVRVKEFEHFGYIEHCGSGKIVHPSKDNRKLVLRGGKDDSALFTFDLEMYTIMHRNGKYWHIKGNNPAPKNGTACLLHEHQINEVGSKNAVISDTTKFYFGKIDAHHLYPYSSPNISHDWKLLQAFITPKTFHSFVINYKVGWGKESHETIRHSWKFSVDAACSFLKSSVCYGGSISLANSSTQTEEKSVSLTINVQKGDTVCVWQYVHCLTHFGDEIVFLSDIIGNTDSLDKKPDMPPFKHSHHQ